MCACLVQARSELDLRVGAAFTRFQTLRLQKRFDSLSVEGASITSVISYGPCQFPTLGFVVERWARIQTFIPEDFWKIDMTILLNADGTPAAQQPTPANEQQQQSTTNNNGNPYNNNNNNNSRQHQGQLKSVSLVWKRVRLYDRQLTMALYESALDAGEAVVTSLTGRPKSKWRPIPLATVDLQKRASKFLRIGSESLMQAAEALYQQGLISYPRTETEKFSPEFNHHTLIQSFTQVPGEFGNYATKLLTEQKFQLPRAGRNDDKAHPPITPCKAINPEQISDHNQRRIYTLIVKHYLACCSQDARGRETELVLTMGTEEFSAKGLMITERNWLEAYHPWERWSTGQGELPSVQVGTRIRPSALWMNQGSTEPPKALTEVELISLMDKNKIGTDATIAQHISTILDRSYATKDNSQRFHPTKLGISLVEGYNSMGYQLNKPDLRRETENECNLVASGQKNKSDIMGPLLGKMKECFIKANAEAHKLDLAVARHFSRLGSNSQSSTIVSRNFSVCGTCQNFMDLKQQTNNLPAQRGNARGNNTNNIRKKSFLYCNSCNTGHILPSRGTYRPFKKPQSSVNTNVNRDTNRDHMLCPICQFQVLEVTKGDGYDGNGYKFCPKCFSDSPIEFGGGSVDFRCFMCTHSTCSLAGGGSSGGVEGTPVFPCSFCSNGKICLKKTERGYVLSCNQYNANRCQYSIWLPKAANAITVFTTTSEENNANQAQNGMNAQNHQDVCSNCSTQQKTVRKLKFTWKPGSVPPHFDRECVTCILCDSVFRRDMNISLPQRNHVGTSSSRRRNDNSGRVTGRGSSASRGRGRGRDTGRGQGRNNGRSW